MHAQLKISLMKLLLYIFNPTIITGHCGLGYGANTTFHRTYFQFQITSYLCAFDKLYLVFLSLYMLCCKKFF